MMNSTIVARTARFGSGGVILRNRDTSRPLAFEQIEQAAPSIFATEAHESRSERFTYIPTADVLRGLQREGFEPFEVRQGGSRDRAKRDYTKHMVRLRHPDAPAAAGGLFPEIILVNAHDGTSSYQLIAGLFRMVCTNGLIAGQAFDAQKVRHTGDVVGNVIEGAFRVIDDAPRLIDGARAMEALALTESEQRAFGRAALALRYDTADGKEPPINADDVVRANRRDDAAPDLWRTFNRVQENLTRGGQHYVTRDADNRVRRGRTRAVNGIDGNRDLNRGLWTLAEEMQRIKAAA